MDLFELFGNLLSSLWFVLPIIIVAGLFKIPWFKGIFGEFLVNTLSRIFLDKNEYHLIKNVTIPTEDGTTQIDHIIVSPYGVFVVETKNMKGWIFGSAHQKRWTQKIFKHSSQFQNPLHQNYKHVKTLQSALDLTDAEVHSLVVFIGESKFKTEMPANVTQGMGYLRYIKSIKEVVLSPERVIDIVERIQAERLTPSFKTHRAHVKHVKEIVREKENQMICQKCGSTMVKRVAKKGVNKGNEFWGCSNYPMCRNIVQMI